ncbi:hypothetical protein SUGI_0031070 [Cryptomeria japonica]|nr:hypothetical protein SUGI_0031070 [Cryptomeria japonica]
MSFDTDEEEVDSWLVGTTEEDDDAANSVDSNPRPPDTRGTPLLPSYLLDLQEDLEDNQTRAIERDLILDKGGDAFRTADLGVYENPSSDSFSDNAEDLEENIADIFRVWEINTDPELEKGTLTDIFTSSLKDTTSDDGAGDFSGSQTSVDALVLKELESVESVIAAMSDLNISISDDNRNG